MSTRNISAVPLARKDAPPTVVVEITLPVDGIRAYRLGDAEGPRLRPVLAWEDEDTGAVYRSAH